MSGDLQVESTDTRDTKLTIMSYGNSMDEMELYALDKAREFFGTDVHLFLQSGRSLNERPKDSQNYPDKKFSGYIVVVKPYVQSRETDPASDTRG